jgi:hypothetical protein
VYVLCPERSRACTFDDGVAYCSVSSTDCLEPSVREAAVVHASLLPTVSLIGPSDVEILRGTIYGACTKLTPMPLQCDRGATAHSPNGGDLTWDIMACKDGFTFRHYGLQACEMDTSVAGSHNISFFLVHGSNQIAVHRTLWVLEVCDGACSRLCFSLFRTGMC